MPVFVVAPYSRSSQSVAQSMRGDARVQVVECKSALDVVPMMRKVGLGVIVAYAPDKGQVIKHIQMLKVLQPLIRRKLIHVVEMTRFNTPAIIDKFHELGCAEILIEPTNPRAVLFKVQRYAASLAIKLQRHEEAAGVSGEGDKRSQGQRGGYGRGTAGAAGAAARGEVKYVEPLELESDCWLLKGGGARNVMGRWLVRLMGPSPSVGKWVPMEDGQSANSDKAFWQWVQKNPDDDTFIKEQGAWIFRGQRPEFRGEVWTFVGKSPELSFFHEKQSYGSKLKVGEDGSLLVANDSEQGLAKLPAIYESIDAVVRLMTRTRKAEEGDEADDSGGDAEGYLHDEAEVPGLADSGEGVEIEGSGSDGPVKRPPPRTDYGEYDGKPPARLEQPEGDSVRELKPGSPGLPAELKNTEGKIYRIAVDQFGDEPGEWSYVCANAAGGKWYIHIPAELASGKTADVRGLPRYWLFLGPEAPVGLQGGNGAIRYWAFVDDKPGAVKRFAELIKPARDFLLDRWGADFKVGAEGSSPEVVDRRRREQGEGPARSAHESGQATDGDWNEHESEGDEAGEWNEDGSEGDAAGDWKEPETGVDDSGRPGGAAPAPMDEQEHERFYVARSDITPEGGEWHYVNADDHGLWHLYVPTPLLTGEWRDLNAIETYFVFAGVEEPQVSEDGENWVFVGGQPFAYDGIISLPPHVQAYLLDLVSQITEDPGAAAAKRGEAKRPPVQSGPGPNPNLDAEDDEAGPEAKKEVATKDPRHPSPAESAAEARRKSKAEAELDAEAEVDALLDAISGPEAADDAADESNGAADPGSEADAQETPDEADGENEEADGEFPDALDSSVPGADEAAEEDPGAEPSVSESLNIQAKPKPEAPKAPDFTGSVSERIRNQKKSLPPAVIEALEQVENTLQDAATRGLGQLAGTGGGPAALTADGPPGPTLGPLAIGVLAAELLTRRSSDPKEAARKFCAYLSSSCGGLSVELWIHANGSWTCGGTQGEGEGTQEAAAKRSQEFFLIKRKRCDFAAEETLVSAIVGHQGGLLGALVLHGEGTSKASPDYLAACAEMALGIVLSLSEDGVLRAAA